MFKVLAAVFVLLMLAAGGGLVLKGKDVISAFGDRLENPPSSTEDDEATPSKAKRKICATLDDAARLDLIGKPTPIKLLNVEGALDPYTCRWAVKNHETVAAFVEVVAAPADKWALSLRRTVVLNPIEPDLKAQLLKILDAPKVTRADGCRFARIIFEARGAARGAERTVTQSAPVEQPSMTAHSCVGGKYYAVLVTAPGLRLDDALGGRLAADLRVVERELG